MNRATLNISLTPQLRRMVTSKVSSGQYQSASEVVREALRLLNERDARNRAGLAEMRKQIKQGLAQARKGDLHDGESFFDNLEAGLRSHKKSK